MKKFNFVILFLLLASYQSSAALMQLHYDQFYAPVSPTNFPVDTSGFVSFIFDTETADQNSDPAAGKFKDPIQRGQMFLRGINYTIDVSQPIEFSTLYSGQSYLKATGNMFNMDLGKVSAFSLYLGGELSPTIGSSLENLQFNGSELHLIVHHPTAAFNSPEYRASYASYENGNVNFASVPVSVPEPNAGLLLMFGVMAVLMTRMLSVRRLVG